MKRLCALVFMVAASTCFAKTVEVAVDGLNCALCSEKMKTQLKQAAGASHVVPRLDCGKIYFDLSKEKQLDEGALRMTLLTSGYSMTGVKDISVPADKAGSALKC